MCRRCLVTGDRAHQMTPSPKHIHRAVADEVAGCDVTESTCDARAPAPRGC